MAFKRLFLLLTMSLLAVTTVNANGHDKKFTLVIDAGHGGRDPGAIGTYSKEKNINLNVALEFGRLVEGNCPDVRVVYTRKTDQSVDLQERADIANRAKADLFISIHTNALAKGRSAFGAETYTLGMARSSENLDVAKRENSAILVEDNYSERYAKFNPNSAESYIIFEFMQDEYMKQSVSLAKSIQKNYVKVAGRQNKGVHQAGFLVLRETSMPSVLTELGFISTPAEEAYLNSDNGVKKMGRSIYEGFLDYKQSQDGKKRATPPYRKDDEPAAKEEKKPEPAPVVKQTASNQPQTDDGIIIMLEPEKPAEAPAKVDNSGSVLGARFGNKTAKEEKSAPAEEKPAATEEKTATKEDNSEAADGQSNASDENAQSDAPVFKIQFLTSDTPLRSTDRRFNDVTGVESYKEGSIIKYTCCPTTDYNEALRNQREVRGKHPDAFVVAFKGDKRMTLNDAIREYKARRK